MQSKARVPFEYSDGKVMQIRAKLLKITPLPHLEVVKKKHLIWYLKAPNTKTNFSHILSENVFKKYGHFYLCARYDHSHLCA